MPTLRLDKIIAGSGLYTRSEAIALIRRGRVAVGGKLAYSGASKLDPESEQVTIEGEPLDYRKYRYVMLNKPRGCISSTNDTREKTVMELMDKKYSKLGLFPAGRLDKDAEGLLLLTNDGEFAHKVTSPANKIHKRYYVEIDGAIAINDIERFANGVILHDGTKCLPAILEPAPGGAFVTLSEGKYHQVKRMIAAIGRKVISLKRVSIGGLELCEGLKPGEYCELSDEINLVFDDKSAK